MESQVEFGQPGPVARAHRAGHVTEDVSEGGDRGADSGFPGFQHRVGSGCFDGLAGGVDFGNVTGRQFQDENSLVAVTDEQTFLDEPLQGFANRATGHLHPSGEPGAGNPPTGRRVTPVGEERVLEDASMSSASRTDPLLTRRVGARVASDSCSPCASLPCRMAVRRACATCSVVELALTAVRGEACVASWLQ